MTKAYRILRDSELCAEAKAGTIVYSYGGHDYGLASNDTEATGIEHVSVTLKAFGGPPSFTIPRRDLEPCAAPEVPRIDRKHMREVCRPGAGAETCRYLTAGARGLSCEKLSMLGITIDMRVDKMVAKGDNCAGRASLS